MFCCNGGELVIKACDVSVMCLGRNNHQKGKNQHRCLLVEEYTLKFMCIHLFVIIKLAVPDYSLVMHHWWIK